MFSRALAKSDEQARAGNLPRLLHDEPGFRRFSVASRTTGGQVWLVDVVPDQPLTCDCERGSGWCWHRTHVERALAGEIGIFLVPAATPAAPEPAPRGDGRRWAGLRPAPSRNAPSRVAPTPPGFFGEPDDDFEPLDASEIDADWPEEP